MKENKVLFITLISALLFILACNFLNQSNTSQVPSESVQAPTSNIFATSVSVGGNHACAVLNNGHVACWGDNSSGQLGDGTFTKHNTATEVPGLVEIASISAGGEYTCALTKKGNVKCWGRNNSGQLGNGTKELSMLPVDVPNLSNVTEISAGTEHTCAVLGDGSGKCWGKNLNGRVGNDSKERIILSPVDVVDLGAKIIHISAGGEHTCAITEDGNVKCWGRNTSGELGIGQDSNFSKIPLDTIGLNAKVTKITTSYAKSCALTTNDKAQCWGWVIFDKFSNSPVAIGNLKSTPVSIALGAYHICIADQNGQVWCIGENPSGQLGDGTTTDSREFIKVSGLSNKITAIGASFGYTCVLSEIGEVWCWGDNAVGQLGNGANENSLLPVRVIGINQ